MGKTRTAEREQLAAAIAARDAADQREATLAKAAERARADAFAARRAVEDAERALNRAREAARESLVDAYVGDDIRTAPSDVIEAERTLATAQRRLSDLQLVEQELGARSGPAPGRSLPSTKVDQAVRAVVKAAPITRRLVEDFRTAERTFQQYHSTLRWLAAHGMIPDDLKDRAPKAHETYHCAPDPAWEAALGKLARDADAELPS
jgi:hypothetical protein